MSLRPETLPPVPDVTAAAVRAAFPKGTLYVDLRTEFGTLYTDQLFADLYPPQGRPVEVAPWRLALVVVMQYIEGLTDRQAADAVRRCMDWKYALSLDLHDPGFDFTLLHDFRQRILAHEAGQRFLDTFLTTCKARGWIKARGTQRTDSTHVLAAIRTLHRLECVLEARHSALNQLSAADPAWVQQHVPLDWYTRYGLRADQMRLPKEVSKREALARHKWAWTAISSWTRSGLPPARRTSVPCPPWRRCCRSGCNNILAAPLRSWPRCAGAPRRSNRRRPCASPRPMSSRPATARDATRNGWAISCTSARPVSPSSPISLPRCSRHLLLHPIVPWDRPSSRIWPHATCCLAPICSTAATWMPTSW